MARRRRAHWLCALSASCLRPHGLTAAAPAVARTPAELEVILAERIPAECMEGFDAAALSGMLITGLDRRSRLMMLAVQGRRVAGLDAALVQLLQTCWAMRHKGAGRHRGEAARSCGQPGGEPTEAGMWRAVTCVDAASGLPHQGKWAHFHQLRLLKQFLRQEAIEAPPPQPQQRKVLIGADMVTT